ncbi:trans-aconitate 2-methyltransferase [Streptomyces phaeochromogenes]|uniref:class I SAM-dependent methyltransferase n=1 Tax=Streptomyces phaeochromogenes TaxID=1923 RepID=UPI0006E2F281|nr:class I SAM-dependent methyltransferase [Streptomyces phaeochromogenes]WSS90777.1 methyltransferase domain-containing protein [Streptomyces phaeochromogenes]WSW20408.1 methyltransferase domain-containing protein [Streptomyces phaeochromogenes]
MNLEYTGDIARLYDLAHQGKGKDYQAEAKELAALVNSRLPEARSLLDVACGTGMHLRYLGEIFDEVEGVDMSPDMLAIAEQRNPDVRIHRGDMRDFALDRRFDAVICMFSSIGHMRDQEELDAAIGRFAAHLPPGGVVIVDPWWFPENFTPGYVGTSLVEAEGRSIARFSHSVIEDGATRIDVNYLVGVPGEGVAHLQESHRITLFERAQYEAAFARAELSVEYLAHAATERGLFIGVRV